MIRVYVALIRAGLKTLDQVPEHLREDVAAALEGDDATEA